MVLNVNSADWIEVNDFWFFLSNLFVLLSFSLLKIASSTWIYQPVYKMIFLSKYWFELLFCFNFFFISNHFLFMFVSSKCFCSWYIEINTIYWTKNVCFVILLLLLNFHCAYNLQHKDFSKKCRNGNQQGNGSILSGTVAAIGRTGLTEFGSNVRWCVIVQALVFTGIDILPEARSWDDVFVIDYKEILREEINRDKYFINMLNDINNNNGINGYDDNMY